jgi:pyrroline-5-carboxylate reductase
MQLAFIGGGTMAEAILKGVLAAKLANPEDIRVGEPIAARREFLSDTYGVAAGPSNLDAAKGAELVMLAIKPQDLPAVFGQMGGHLGPDQAALSIIAGAKIDTLAQGLSHGPIIRVMPNTPAQIGQGMSVWTCASEVNQQMRGLARSVLETVGKEVYVDDEKYLDMATALSGSGPAYVFLVIEALIDAGVYVGLPREVARTAALQTLYGSAKLALESGMSAAELKAMVVSPGGTTAEGLQTLERAGVPAALVDAVNAAYLKSVKLGQQ